MTSEAVDHLRELGEELKHRRFIVHVRAPRGRPPALDVINTVAPVLQERVFTGPDAQGKLWFWFPWPAPITPVTDIAAAADRVERVLAEVGRPAQ
jgi:hypothetical protein